MFNKQFSIFMSSFILLVGIFTLSPSISVQAESTGCAMLNAAPNYNAPPTHAYQVMGEWFDAGEIVTWTVDSDSWTYAWVGDSGGSDLVAEAEYYDGTPISGSYTVPISDWYYFVFTADEPYTLDITCGPAVATSSGTSEEPSAVYPPDNRTNWQYGDLYATIFSDGDGFVLYCAGNPNPAMRFSQARIDNGFANRAEQASRLGRAVRVATINNADCRAILYILPSGEYQINITSPEGKIYEIISETLDFANPTMRYFDPNE